MAMIKAKIEKPYFIIRVSINAYDKLRREELEPVGRHAS